MACVVPVMGFRAEGPGALRSDMLNAAGNEGGRQMTIGGIGTILLVVAIVCGLGVPIISAIYKAICGGKKTDDAE